MKLNKKLSFIIILSILLVILGGLFSYINFNRSSNLNILLITIDALRPDHLGCYGYRRNTSPNIDKLAEEGVLFTQAISQTPWTGGSLASILTATYPSTHHVNEFGNIINKSLVTLPEVFKRKNYYTAAVGETGHFKALTSFERGFDYLFDSKDTLGSTKDIIKWIRNFKNKKFFVWIHFFDYPHAPYVPPYPFNQMFVTNNKSKHLPIGKGNEFYGVIPEWVAINNITDVDYYISQYDGEIAFVDSLIGEILNTLKNENLDKKTIIIISADHGESLGERDLYFQHGDCLYNHEIRVPLIITGKIIPKGRIIKYPVQLIDLMPSIVDMLRINADIKAEGSSFFPLILNKNKLVTPAFSEAGVTKMVNGSEVNAEQKSIITGEWKLIYETSEYGARYELYNLKNDPGELTDLVDIEKEQFKVLKARLEEWMNRPKPNIISSAKPLDEETKKRLKSLGYLQ
jgi:arylsulfatase A-like enzyme